MAGAGVALPLPGFAESAGPSDAGNAAPTTPGASPYTRGIGHYPGAHAENFSPTLSLDRTTYRNLALLRPAYHSSSYDYNLTAQLVTDGIKDTHLPTWVSTSVDGLGILPKQDREIFLDHSATNTLELKGASPAVQIQLGGGEAVPAVDRITVFFVVPDSVDASTLSISVSTSDDGRVWKQVGSSSALTPLSPVNYPPDLGAGSHLYNPLIPLQQVCQSRYYQVQCHSPATVADGERWQWRVGQIAFYKGEQRVQLGGPYTFTSAWMSAGLGEEWVYVDLGARCSFDRIALHWIARAAEGSIQVSDDAHTWRTLQAAADAIAQVDDLKLSTPQQARYVRVLMTRPSSPNGYILSEFEVYGRGGPVAQAKPAQPPLMESSTLLVAHGACSDRTLRRVKALRSRNPASRTIHGSSPPFPARCSRRTSTSKQSPTLTTARTSSTSPTLSSMQTSGIAPNS